MKEATREVRANDVADKHCLDLLLSNEELLNQNTYGEISGDSEKKLLSLSLTLSLSLSLSLSLQGRRQLHRLKLELL